MATRYGTKAGEKVEKAMHEMHEGTLKNGSIGKKVTSRKQAIAIGLSEAREAGAKVPEKPSPKKSTARSSDSDDAPKKKTTAKKTTSGSAVSKKVPAKKIAAKK